MSEVVGLPAVLGNDADVAGLAEALHGAGKGLSPIFYITIGSGIGGGFIIDGEIYRGVGRGAAEIGHLVVDSSDDGAVILEKEASGWAIEGHARGVYNADRTAVRVAEAARQGDAAAMQILSDAWDHLADAIRHVVVLLCPRRIVIGGGVSFMGEELLFDPLRRKVAERMFKPFADLLRHRAGGARRGSGGTWGDRAGAADTRAAGGRRMSTEATTKLLTAEEFCDWVHLPENDNRWFELVRGEVIELPPPMKPHGVVAIQVGRILANYAEQVGKGYLTGNDSGVILERDPDTVRGPDIAYYEDAATFAELHPKYGETPPRLAVEILSRNDRAKQVTRKITDYLNNGDGIGMASRSRRPHCHGLSS